MKFTVTVKRIMSIEPHPNADNLEFAVIDGYRSVVKKNLFKKNDLVVYVPEASVVPEWLLKEIGLWDTRGKGMLAGPDGNRVKAIKLRGELSQGICLEVVQDTATTGVISTGPSELDFALVNEGDDVAAHLGITKYEAPVPVAMSGEVFGVDTELTVTFDVENIRSFPDLLRDGEPVFFTEKLHGTCTCVTVLPEGVSHHEAFGKNKDILIYSKGIGKNGLTFKNNDKNKNSLYVRATQRLVDAIDTLERGDTPTHFLGESFGHGVQDLSYGTQLDFRLFAVAKGRRGGLKYVDFCRMTDFASEIGIKTVPVLYRGPFSMDAVNKYTSGKTSMDAHHIREGIVIVPAKERTERACGRVCLKSVSSDYLTRNGGTEHQ